MPFVFNPFTGTLDKVNTSGGGSGNFLVDKFTLSGTDITNKFVTLTTPPAVASKTILAIVGGSSSEDYGVDFSVSGSQLTWSGLALDGVLSIGDKIIIEYS